MASANVLNILIKQSATQAINQSKPVALVFGSVVSISPLQIQTEERLTLNEIQLILARNVTDHTVSVTMDWTTENSLTTHTHGVEGSTESGGSPSHSHSISFTSESTSLAHAHSTVGTKNITINNGLSVGESVVLIRMQGGQKYLVLDRVVGT